MEAFEWSRNDDFLINSDPALSGERVFFGGMNGAVYAFDAKSGKEVWRRSLDARISTSIAVLENNLYVGTIAGHLYRLSMRSGEIVGDYALGVVSLRRLVAQVGRLERIQDRVVLEREDDSGPNPTT